MRVRETGEVPRGGVPNKMCVKQTIDLREREPSVWKVESNQQVYGKQRGGCSVYREMEAVQPNSAMQGSRGRNTGESRCGSVWAAVQCSLPTWERNVYKQACPTAVNEVERRWHAVPRGRKEVRVCVLQSPQSPSNE